MGHPTLIIRTSELEWDPLSWIIILKKMSIPELESSFDEIGGYKHWVIVQHWHIISAKMVYLLDDVIDQCCLDSQTSQVLHELVFHDAHETELGMPPPDDTLPEPTSSDPKVITRLDPDYEQLRPFFGWLARELTKRTFEHTIQYARLHAGTLLKKAFKSPNPALNI
jgi:hypothetical protein